MKRAQTHRALALPVRGALFLVPRRRLCPAGGREGAVAAVMQHSLLGVLMLMLMYGTLPPLLLLRPRGGRLRGHVPWRVRLAPRVARLQVQGSGELGQELQGCLAGPLADVTVGERSPVLLVSQRESESE